MTGFKAGVLANNAICADRPSRFFAQDFNACGVAGGGTMAALACFVELQSRAKSTNIR